MFDFARLFVFIAVVGIVTGGILMAVNNTHQQLHAGITTDEIILGLL